MYTNVILTNQRCTHAQSNCTSTKLKAWFRRLLRHTARKRSGSILHPGGPTRACRQLQCSYCSRKRRQYCFQHRPSFFRSYQDNSWTAALSLMKFCQNMYIGNIYNPTEYQGHRSKGQGHMGVYVRFLSARYPRAVLSLERGFILASVSVSVYSSNSIYVTLSQSQKK